MLASNDYYESILIEEYGKNYKIESFTKNSNPYLFTKNGINSKDIQQFIGAFIYMVIEKLVRIDMYWEQSNLLFPKKCFILFPKKDLS